MQQRNTATRRTLGARLTRMRLMHRKSTGIVAVYEQDDTEPAGGLPTLVFEAGSVRTRTTEFPRQWQVLSDDELAAIRKRTLE